MVKLIAIVVILATGARFENTRLADDLSKDWVGTAQACEAMQPEERKTIETYFALTQGAIEGVHYNLSFECRVIGEPA